MAFKKVNKRGLALRLVGEHPATFSIPELALVCHCTEENLTGYVLDGTFKRVAKKLVPRLHVYAGKKSGKIEMREVSVVSLTKKGWGRVNNSAGKSSAPWNYCASAIKITKPKKGKM